ncbi:uncharacterized protein FTOL_13907 [Fusarium torulosum]|uniref:Uncharacterized protein n=1 Tax=Fusarium torulosum TaxID=33205 RepID=A0AAE8SQA7_9HYPO|nr:uncharacterized protein FTOL_13907 [Fusarium torulosum]
MCLPSRRPEGSTPYPAGELAFELVSLFLAEGLGPLVEGPLGFSSSDILSRNPATPDDNLVFLRGANLLGAARVALAMGSHLGQIIRAAECTNQPGLEKRNLGVKLFCGTAEF